MLLPGDFKRKYRFKSDTKKDRLGYIIAIALSALALLFLLFWE